MTDFECIVIGVTIFIGFLAFLITDMRRNLLYLIAFMSKSSRHTINVMNYVFNIYPNLATKDIARYYEQIEEKLKKTYVLDSDIKPVLGLLNFKKRQAAQNSVDFIFYERCIELIEKIHPCKPDSSKDIIGHNLCLVIMKILGIAVVMMVFSGCIFNIKIQRDMLIRENLEKLTVAYTEDYKYCPYCGKELPGQE